MGDTVDFDDGERMAVNREHKVGCASHVDETESVPGHNIVRMSKEREHNKTTHLLPGSTLMTDNSD